MQNLRVGKSQISSSKINSQKKNSNNKKFNLCAQGTFFAITPCTKGWYKTALTQEGGVYTLLRAIKVSPGLPQSGKCQYSASV